MNHLMQYQLDQHRREDMMRRAQQEPPRQDNIVKSTRPARRKPRRTPERDFLPITETGTFQAV